jgi:hypothetical protein
LQRLLGGAGGGMGSGDQGGGYEGGGGMRLNTGDPAAAEPERQEDLEAAKGEWWPIPVCWATMHGACRSLPTTDRAL